MIVTRIHTPLKRWHYTYPEASISYSSIEDLMKLKERMKGEQELAMGIEMVTCGDEEKKTSIGELHAFLCKDIKDEGNSKDEEVELGKIKSRY